MAGCFVFDVVLFTEVVFNEGRASIFELIKKVLETFFVSSKKNICCTLQRLYSFHRIYLN